MNQVKIPTCGRAVHYFPMDCSEKENNGKLKFAAIVATDDMNPDLHVFYHSEKTPVVFLKSVPHRSEYKEHNSGFWDWPEIK